MLPASGAAMVRLLGELRHAIDHGELVLAYQPKYRPAHHRDRGCGGATALAAFHPRRLLRPDEFLPLVRRHGLMGAVTDLVVDKALDQAAAWRSAGINVPIAVNLFAPSLADLTLPARIAAALDERGLSASVLTVEITEHLFLDHTGRAQKVLLQLREQGIRIAIDDFGKGYSALSYLRDLPIDEVKLDRQFIGRCWWTRARPPWCAPWWIWRTNSGSPRSPKGWRTPRRPTGYASTDAMSRRASTTAASGE